MNGDDGREDLPAWGAIRLADGKVRFRTWAPEQQALTLRVAGQDHPMPRDEDGWFELSVADLPSASAYSFVLPDGRCMPDPASRSQFDDVHGDSLVTEPDAFAWSTEWRGRPWEDAVVYELHVGAFTPEGTFQAAIEKLDHIADTGITAIEIMPIAQFSGWRGWGYDGVLPYAPHNAYGSPDDLRALVDAAHARGLMVILDVVYNHFGPDGNYLPVLAPQFFDPDRHTPWGGGIAYEKLPVRRFFIDNALYWLDEFRLDGLRLDAIDHVIDSRSEKDILIELAEEVRRRFPDREIHLTSEDNRNVTFLHERKDGRVALYTAEWNDDFHNAAHVVATREDEGYYRDFVDDPVKHVARTLAEGFAYQGDVSEYGGGMPRGHPSGHLPPQAFVNFLQNHDQVGNRAFAERLPLLSNPAKIDVLSAILLLSPAIPLLFMGEEYGEENPFYFFTDFHDELGQAVRDGRRREFSHFAHFSGGRASEIPDPNAISTFEQSRLDWTRAEGKAGREIRNRIASLLALRRMHIVPLLRDTTGYRGELLETARDTIAVDWHFPAAELHLRANLSDRDQPVTMPASSGTKVIHRTPAMQEAGDRMAPWSALFSLTERPA